MELLSSDSYVVRTTTFYQCWLFTKTSRPRFFPAGPLWYVSLIFDPVRLVLISQKGECKEQMMQYMNCLRQNSSTSTPCRVLSKDYLDCRMNQ